MYIGVFVSKLPIQYRNSYGSEKYTYNLLKGLANLGNEICVFVPDTYNEEKNISGMRIFFFKSQLRYKDYKLALNMLFKPLKYKFDVINIHNDAPFEMLSGLIYSYIRKTPLIINWHGDWIGDNKLRKFLIFILNKTIIKLILNHVKAIRVPSSTYSIRSNLLRKYKDKINVIPNGIDLKICQLKLSKIESKSILKIKKKFVVLFLSHLSKIKGADIFIKAIPYVLKEFKDIEFILVGGGEINNFYKLAEVLNAHRNVKFTGYKNGKEKWLYYNAADIFVFPSIAEHEIFGNVNIEAALFKLPIIASDLPVLKDIIKNNINGIFFERGNHKELAEKIILLIRNEELRNTLGKNARKIVEDKFSSFKMINKMQQLFKQVVKNNSKKQ